jgi:hypothetical protein
MIPHKIGTPCYDTEILNSASYRVRKVENIRLFFSRKTVLNSTVILETKFSDIAKDSYIHQASQNIASHLEWYFLKL